LLLRTDDGKVFQILVVEIRKAVEPKLWLWRGTEVTRWQKDA